MAALVVVCFFAPAQAIDPHRLISQYSRERWGDRRGFTGGSISAIAQTADGYLWIGSEKGLTRFDGLNFRIFQQAIPESFPIGPVKALVTDAGGNLWVLLRSTNILRFHQGKFELGREEAEFGVTAIGRQRNGTILFSSLAYGTLTYKGGRFERLVSRSSEQQASPTTESAAGNDDLSSRLSWATSVASHHFAAPNSAVVSMVETIDGKLWLGTQDRGLFYMSDGRVSAVGKKGPPTAVTCLLPLEDGELWIGTEQGVVAWTGATFSQKGVPTALRHAQVRTMIRDRDANIWVGTARGLFRFNGDGVSFDGSRRETSGPVTALFEDREGNVWVGRPSSIERLRDSAFVTYSVAGRESESGGPIYVDEEERVWFAPFDGGLQWLKGAERGPVTNDVLEHDVVYSIVGGRGELWIGRQRGGLTHLRYGAGSVTTKTYTQADGLAQNSVYAVHKSRDGSVWSGTLSGGVSVLKNGHFKTYTTSDGLPSNTISSIAEASDGTMWFGTPNGLGEMSKETWKTYTVRDGLSSQDINCLLQDSTGVLWIGTADGLAFLTAGHIQVLRGASEFLNEPVFGIAEDRTGWLWIVTASHVLQVRRSGLAGGVLSDTDVREYRVADGLQGTDGIKRHRSVIEDPQGQIWFSTNRGLSVVNPARATVNPVPALVHIEGVWADGSPFDIKGPIRISARQQRITFRFAGLSLVNPQRVRYRYQLDGLDHGWSEPVTTPEASYTNLAPGSYRFRVNASNGDGIWNSTETSVALQIEPALWQTWWFSVLCASLGLLGVWFIFQVRVRQIAAGMNARFDERIAERNRVATELHDTILQTVQATKMIADNARYGHSADPVHLRSAIENISDWLAEATTEGRAALNNLRASTTQRNDLAGALQQTAQTSGVISSMRFVLSVEGAAQDLHPIVRDEIYRIGTEAIRNAHQHSEATELEVNISYAHNLTVRVRDNGIGIDPEFTTSGKPGHFGLQGMQERAIRIHGTLHVMSRPNYGTEVELVIPGKIAFRDQHNGRRTLYARLRGVPNGRIFSHKRPDPKVEQGVQ